MRQLDLARIDHDQLGAMQSRLLDSSPDNGMVLSSVCPAHENCSRSLNVVIGVGGGAGSQHQLHRRGSGRVADSRAAIYVIRADYDARKLLRQVRFFVRAPSRSQDANTVWSILAGNLLQSIGSERDRFIPGDSLPPVRFANHRFRNAILRRNKVKGITTLDTEMTAINGSVENRFDRNEFVIFRADAQLAASAAIRAGRSRPCCRYATGENRLVF